MNRTMNIPYLVYYASQSLDPLALALALKPANTRTQATIRREVRRRSNLPRAIQKRLGFKCH